MTTSTSYFILQALIIVAIGLTAWTLKAWLSYKAIKDLDEEKQVRENPREKKINRLGSLVLTLNEVVGQRELEVFGLESRYAPGIGFSEMLLDSFRYRVWVSFDVSHNLDDSVSFVVAAIDQERYDLFMEFYSKKGYKTRRNTALEDTVKTELVRKAREICLENGWELGVDERRQQIMSAFEIV